MRFRTLLLLFLLITFGNKAFSAVFVVTSNADSGPGTLRDALTQAAANGSVTQDIIQFNLPDLSVAGRTILLINQLPDVSSNLIIDGTTQTGATFGQSNAHIKISTPAGDSQFIVFNGTNVSNIEFYGLYLYDHENVSNFYADLKSRTGINLQHASNITIGAANKGNLIKGFDTYSISFGYGSFITLKSNILGLSDSNDLSEGTSAGVYFLSSNNISIGGSAAGEGNIIFTGLEITFDQNAEAGLLNIASNNFGAYKNSVTGELVLLSQTLDINTQFINEYGPSQQELATRANVKIIIDNNVVCTDFIGFRINALKGSIDFTKNYLGIYRDGITPVNVSHVNAYVGSQIYLDNCSSQINIGTTDIADKNFIAYSNYGITSGNCDNIFVRNNEYQCLGFVAYGNDNANGALPKVAITSVNSTNTQTSISGTSDAGATIDIYSSESCTYAKCSIRKYIQTVIADNTGHWASEIFNLNGIFYVSSTVNNRTSEYETFQVNSDKVVVTNLRCNTASITGLQVPSGISYYWTDQNGNILSNNIDLTTSVPGKYQLNLAGGCITSDVYQIVDQRVVVYDYSLVKTDVSCNTNNGSIKNLFVYDPLSEISTETWKDGSGKVVGNTLDIANLTAGTYTLTVNTTDGCTITYGPVVLKNTTGPNIDQSNAVIQSTNCGQSSGSITNITATGSGTLKYSWLNNQQQQVGTNIDLLNQPAGTYKLQVTDATQCGPVYTTDIQIPETNGITLDESKAQTTIVICGQNNGSITGIQITGATQYQWVDANNKIVGTDPDLKNVAAGDYTLAATNSYGCIKTSQVYHIASPPPTLYPTYDVKTTSACFGKANGSITVSVDDLATAERWVDAQGTTLGTGPQLSNIAAGSYDLYLTDKNGCETDYSGYNLGQIPQLLIAAGSDLITNDQCSLKKGSISNIEITGGMQPYTYLWVDANNNQISTSANLSNVGTGTYTLNISDASTCGPVMASYTVQDLDMVIAPPLVNNVQLCNPGGGLLQVSNPSATYSYKLYDSQTNPTPLDEQSSGNFKIAVKANTSYYVSEISGDCESSRTMANVIVGLSSVDIANAFTPNGDGINDYWKITGIESYPAATVQVFNRYGQKVFESKGYSTPFNGTMGGKNLPVGVYYYIINLSLNCNLLSGSLTIIR